MSVYRLYVEYDDILKMTGGDDFWRVGLVCVGIGGMYVSIVIQRPSIKSVKQKSTSTGDT